MAYRSGRPQFTHFRNRKRGRDRPDLPGPFGNEGPSGSRSDERSSSSRDYTDDYTSRGGREKHSRSYNEHTEFGHGRDRGRGRGRGRGHPPHLKGREIGLYYASLSKGKKKVEKPEQKNKCWTTVLLDPQRERHIRELLDSLPSPYLPSKHDSSSLQSPETTEPSTSREQPLIVETKQHETEEYIAAFVGKTEPIDSEDLKALHIKQESPDLDESHKRARSEYEEALSSPKHEVRSDSSSEVDDSFELVSKRSRKRPRSLSSSQPENKSGNSTNNYDHVSDSHFKRNFLRSINETIEAKIHRLLQSHLSLPRNESIDEHLKNSLVTKQSSSAHYQTMLEFRKKLPSYSMQEEILKLVKNNQVIVVSGETGCGKTTQVAQFILDDYIMQGEGSLCRVVCTQPRRISATSVAERVANERDEKLGELSVGYQIRLEKKLSPKQGSILYCTAGIFLQWMQTDPSVCEMSHIVLDEIHERDTTSDFIITLLKGVLPKRPDLKLILMSATLNADHFSRYFGNCPCINIPGFTFPVEELYLEDVLEITKFQFEKRRLQRGIFRQREAGEEFSSYVEPYIRNLEHGKKYSTRTLNELRNPESEEMNIDLMARLVEYIFCKKPMGAILIFVPGWEQISKLNKVLTDNKMFSRQRCLIIPLHSMMPTSVQRSVFDRPPEGIRKIVIATNIAETSITIDDVVYVIDCGKIKMKNYDVKSNIQTLQAEWVSLANARQRRGRAGRVQPGICYHLYSRGREMAFANYPLPEILRTRLDEVILQTKILQLGKARSFLSRLMNPPEPQAIDVSLELLRRLNALDPQENLTPLGYHLAKLPVDPQTGKMLLMGAIFNCVDPVFSVAASLSFKEAFQMPLGKEKLVDQKKVELSRGSKSDHLLLADALIFWEEEEQRGRGNNFCWEYFLSSSTLKMLRDMKKQFAQYLHDMNFLESTNPKATSCNLNSNNRSLVKAIICAGLYPNVAFIQSVRRNSRRMRVKMTTPEDGAVFFHPKSVNDKTETFESPIILYHLKLKSSKVYLHDSSMVFPLPLLFFGEALEYQMENGVEMVKVGKDIRFQCKERTADIVMELREHLDTLFEHRVSHPGTVDWHDNTSSDSLILRAIVELITFEDEGMAVEPNQSDDDNEDHNDYDDDLY